QARVGVRAREAQRDKVLVVPEPDVESRPVLLDQLVLEEERVLLARGDHHLDVAEQVLEEGDEDPAVAGALLEVLRHPRAQVDGLADVHHRAGAVLHDVAAGLGRQRVQLPLQLPGQHAQAILPSRGRQRRTPPPRLRGCLRRLKRPCSGRWGGAMPAAARASARRTSGRLGRMPRSRSLIAWTLSRSIAAPSKSSSSALACISDSSCAMSFGTSRLSLGRYPASSSFPARASSPSVAIPWICMSRMARLTLCGVMPCASLYAFCLARRRSVSSS